MASTYIGNYCIYYSIVDGTIHEFKKQDSDGNYKPVNNEKELIKIAKELIAIQSERRDGYSAFIYKLVEDGKVELPN